MPEKLNLILLYTSKNRYSLNALLGAIEGSGLGNLNVIFAKNKKEILQALDKNAAKEKTVLAVSFFTEQKEEIKKLAGELKTEKKRIFFMVGGGPHASAIPEDLLNWGFDFAIKGEGEKVFPELLKTISAGGCPSEKIISSKEKISLDHYPSFSKKYLRFGPIEITRGCPYACKFCQTSFLFGAKYRHRSVSGVTEQVIEMAKIGLDDIRFLTPNALSYGCGESGKPDLKAVEELLRAVKKNINSNGRIFFGTFPSEIRPEHINEETLSLLEKYIYNRQITIGVQTASDRLLKLIHRGHTIREAEDAVKVCLKKGFKPILDLIFGLPYENKEDLELTLDFMERISKRGAVIHTHSFTPLPGTPFAGERLGEIPKKLRLKIKHLENKKLAFGKWEKETLK